LIPRDVMISLGLNRLEKEEEIQRYQFKRLVSSAKNVYLLYQDRYDTQKSRFIEELIWKSQLKMNSLQALPIIRAAFKVTVMPKKEKIKKDAQMITYLSKREYSASSLNTYLQCPLRFYFQYVLGLRQRQDLLDEPAGQDIGIFVHEFLHEAFRLFIGKKPDFSDKFCRDFFALLDRKFAADFEKMRPDAFLIKEVLTFRMARFLENEKTRGVEELLGLEQEFRGSLSAGKHSFNFKAIIDRIDYLGGQNALIIDYKTGSVDMMPEGSLDKLGRLSFTREAIKESIKSFQLPLYLYLASGQARYKEMILNACLYSLRDAGSGRAIARLFKDDDYTQKQEIMDIYLKAVSAMLLEMVNPEIPFEADESDSRFCALCPFVNMCR
jgi:ATP-dependent helicase/nuclease subunit B